MTVQTLDRKVEDYILGLLGIGVAYLNTTEVSLLITPALVHAVIVEVTTLSAGVNLSLNLADTVAGSTPVRIVVPSVFVGRTPILFPTPVLFADGVRCVPDQTTGAGRISIAYEALA